MSLGWSMKVSKTHFPWFKAKIAYVFNEPNSPRTHVHCARASVRVVRMHASLHHREAASVSVSSPPAACFKIIWRIIWCYSRLSRILLELIHSDFPRMCSNQLRCLWFNWLTVPRWASFLTFFWCLPFIINVDTLFSFLRQKYPHNVRSNMVR